MSDTTELAELRAEVRAWVRANLPENWVDATADPAAARQWFEALGRRGYTVPHWPSEHGGLGYDEERAAVVRSVLARYRAELPTYHFVPIILIGPGIMAWGTDEQQRRYLPGIATGADMWCQLFSEPGAGSDLASLATRAVPDPATGGWRVTGQKVWSSFASLSRYGMLLARTDPERPKNAGITCFLLDLTSPGVTVRPLRQITGDEHFCEVFLEDVLLPADSMLGPVNDGWRVAMSTLNAERSGLSETTDASGVPLGPVLDLARENRSWGEPAVRDRLTQLIAVERALALTNERAQAAAASGSITKLVLSEMSQRITEVAFELAGPGAAYWDGDEVSAQAHGLLDSRRLTIAGGTSEIQRNIVAERVLGLEREIDPQRGRPWRESRRG